MRSGPLFWGLVGALAFLHFLLHLGLGLGRAAPDLLTVAVLLGARTGGAGVGAGLGFFFGLLEDAFSILAFGANTVAMTIVGALGARTRDLFVGDSVVFVLGYVAAGKWLRDLIYWIVAGEPVREPFLKALVVQGVLAALYAGVVAALFMLAAGGLQEARA